MYFIRLDFRLWFGMRLWVDVNTPKQVLFFNRLVKRHAERFGRGNVLVTIRGFRETVGMAGIVGLRGLVVGRHGGADIAEKLRASIERMRGLFPVVREFDPDVAVSLSSPEAARISFGLGKPHVCTSDAPHSFAASRLAIPLSRYLATPSYIPKRLWVKYGIEPERIVQYRALDPWAWLIDFRPNPRVLEEVGVGRDALLIVGRLEESEASYLLGKSSLGSRTAAEGLRRVVRDWGAQLVLIPRYASQMGRIKELYGDFATVVERTIDGASLLSFTDVFIGGGGTMTVEAALLGVPSISVYPSVWWVEKVLLRRRLIRKTTPRDLPAVLERILRRLDRVKERTAERSRRFREEMEDPIPVIESLLQRASQETEPF